jgi:uncharacterized coiled-coil protein SlyX
MLADQLTEIHQVKQELARLRYKFSGVKPSELIQSNIEMDLENKLAIAHQAIVQLRIQLNKKELEIDELKRKAAS